MTRRRPPYTLGAQAGEDLGKATGRLRTLVSRLQTVSEKGLERHLAASLLRLYAASCSQYPLRLGDASTANSIEYDSVVKEACGGG